MHATTKGRSPVRSLARVAARSALKAIAAAFAVIGLTASPAGAQVSRPDRPSSAQPMRVPGGWLLIGFVKDQLGNAIEGAEIVIGSDATRVTTDEQGRFRLAGIQVGVTYVGARRLGYVPAMDLVRLSPADTLQFVLEHIGQKADTVKVKARAQAAWERDLRRYAMATEAARYGTVLTDRDIAVRAPIVTSDLLQARSGFTVIGAGASARVLGSRSRCSPTVILDGQALIGFNVNDILPNTIKLLVTYPGFAVLPIALQNIRGDPNCGVIAITTQ